MRHRITSAFFVLAALVPVLAGGSACSSKGGAAAAADASDDGRLEAAGDDASDAPFDAGPGADTSDDACTLGDHVTDPVALCTQQQVLRAEVQYAYAKGRGVAPGWSSVGPGYAALSGHAWQDDLGLAGALGAYLCSASVYGNNASTVAFDATLADLGGVLASELQATPSPLLGIYDGEIYFRLRWAQAAYTTQSDSTAMTLQSLADAYGASLATRAYPVTPGADGGSPGGVVIGAVDTDGSVTYAPAQSVMAAAALLDMAALHSNGADGGAAQAWASTAVQVLGYVLSRGRDPATGLFYQSLVTSGDPMHDTPAAGTPTSDSMLTETQAWITLGLARPPAARVGLAPPAGGGAAGGQTPVAYWGAGAALASAMTSAGLFDGTASPPTPPPPGAFMEGLVLSSGGLLTNKTTIGNAIMLGGLHRVVVGAGASAAYALGELRSALVQFAPASSSLFTIVTDSAGNPEQQAYLRAGSKSFGYALAYPVDAGALEPGSTNYRSDAVHAMVEGFSQLWRGAPDDARCAL